MPQKASDRGRSSERSCRVGLWMSLRAISSYDLQRLPKIRICSKGNKVKLWVSLVQIMLVAAIDSRCNLSHGKPLQQTFLFPRLSSSNKNCHHRFDEQVVVQKADRVGGQEFFDLGA
jgi:hypothetical protein